MTNDKNAELSLELRKFIAEHINSIEQLEVLLLLVRSSPKEWTAVEITHELTSSIYAIETRLFDLRSRGLIVSRLVDECILFHYSAGPFDPILGQLNDVYRLRRVAVIETIFKRPPDNILKTFGDAFRIRKEGR